MSGRHARFKEAFVLVLVQAPVSGGHDLSSGNRGNIDTNHRSAVSSIIFGKFSRLFLNASSAKREASVDVDSVVLGTACYNVLHGIVACNYVLSKIVEQVCKQIAVRSGPRE